MKIALDVDGVLANFSEAFQNVIRVLYGKYTIPEGYVPKDWHWSEVLTPEMEKAGFAEIAKTPNFWLSLKPIQEGIAAVKQLIEVPGLDIYFLTARAPSPGGTIATQTKRWLEMQYIYGENYAGVIAVGKPNLKRQILEGIGIEAMIDDHGPTVESFDAIPGFQGYLLARPWNDTAKVKNVCTTVREFGERIGCLPPSKALTPKIALESKKFLSPSSLQLD